MREGQGGKSGGREAEEARQAGGRDGNAEGGRGREGKEMGEGRESVAQDRQGRVGTKWWLVGAGVKVCCRD